MAVGRCAHHRLRGDVTGGAGPVVDEELLSQTVREPLSDQARNNVDLAAGRKPDDNADRPLRIGLRSRDPRRCWQRRGAHGQMQKCSTGKFHAGLKVCHDKLSCPPQR